jgi:hypothetical protein
MLAPLNSHQEEALRNIGIGSAEPLDPVHVRRLLQLELIDSVRRRPSSRFRKIHILGGKV